jgi:hypothetical protein
MLFLATSRKNDEKIYDAAKFAFINLYVLGEKGSYRILCFQAHYIQIRLSL